MSKIIQIEEEVLAKALAVNFAGIQLVTEDWTLADITREKLDELYEIQMENDPENILRGFANDFDNLEKNMEILNMSKAYSFTEEQLAELVAAIVISSVKEITGTYERGVAKKLKKEIINDLRNEDPINELFDLYKTFEAEGVEEEDE